MKDAFNASIKEAEDKGLSAEMTKELRQLIREHNSVFCTSFSYWSSADVLLLKIELAPDAQAVRVNLDNY